MHLYELKRIFLSILLLASLSENLIAQTQEYGRSELAHAPNIQLELLSEKQSIAPGDSFTLALRILPEEHWHIYWRNPGDTGLPTKVSWQENPLISFSDLQWSVPSRAEYQGFINYGYYGETYLFSEAKATDNLIIGQDLKLGVKVDWLICEEICIPGSATLELELFVSEQSVDAPWAPQIETAYNKLPEKIGRLAGTYRVDEGFQVAIQLPEKLQELQPLGFFPISAKLVDNLPVPDLRKPQNDTLLIRTENATSVDGYPSTFEGLLIMENGQGTPLAYQFGVEADASVPLNSLAEPAASLPFILILLFALLGGLILNLMPCVLPVLSLKIMHLVEENNSASRHIQGLAYTAGVVLSFLLIAGLMLALRAAGQSIGWGFQLQSPIFIAVLAYVLFVLGLSLSGFLELGASLTRLGSIGTHISGPVSGSFMTGALATIVATPCTAPFMGAAMGAAVTMSPLPALLVFATLGLGLALPFLLISFVPAFARRIPQPGQWMATLKEALAFPLYLTVIWLLWVFANQTSTDQLALIMFGLVSIVFGLWLRRINRSGSNWLLGGTLAAWALALSILPNIGTTDDQGLVKLPYSDQALASALANDRPVFVNLTADWCITCKVNERVALSNTDVENYFEEQGIVYLEGDWTNADKSISEVLERFDRNGVPLYLVYLPGQSEPQILPQILTPSIILNAYAGA